jgi:hypothetical protein
MTPTNASDCIHMTLLVTQAVLARGNGHAARPGWR